MKYPELASVSYIRDRRDHAYCSLHCQKQALPCVLLAICNFALQNCAPPGASAAQAATAAAKMRVRITGVVEHIRETCKYRKFALNYETNSKETVLESVEMNRDKAKVITMQLPAIVELLLPNPPPGSVLTGAKGRLLSIASDFVEMMRVINLQPEYNGLEPEHRAELERVASAYQETASRFFDSTTALFTTSFVSCYMHVLAAHMKGVMLRHGYLGRLANEGVEALQGICTAMVKGNSKFGGFNSIDKETGKVVKEDAIATVRGYAVRMGMRACGHAAERQR